MNYYKMIATVFYKGKELRSRYAEFLTEEEPHDSVTKITWGNIEDLYKYATCEIKDCKRAAAFASWEIWTLTDSASKNGKNLI